MTARTKKIISELEKEIDSDTYGKELLEAAVMLIEAYRESLSEDYNASLILISDAIKTADAHALTILGDTIPDEVGMIVIKPNMEFEN